MTLSHRQKITLISLLVYWPAIFILTHIPLSLEVLRQIQPSDKTLHFLAYFILSFLLYFAAAPSGKLSFRSKKIWLLFLVLVLYAAVDEWLQGLVGRSCDFLDFLANLTGVVAAFVVLSFFSFWPALLIFTAVSILVITKAAQMRFTGRLSFIKPAVYSLAYAFFTISWCRFICSVNFLKSSALKWLSAAFVLPVTVLIAAGIFSFIIGNSFQLPEIICSLAAILAAVTVTYFTRRFG